MRSRDISKYDPAYKVPMTNQIMIPLNFTPGNQKVDWAYLKHTE